MLILPFQKIVNRTQRQKLNGHRSGLVWLTGLSGSGKSTLAYATETYLFKLGVRCYVLDGDNIRRGLNRDLSLSPSDRMENVRRVGEVARLMVDSGLIVIAAFITPYAESRALIRQLMEELPYIECFVRCPLEVCEARDPKGLYKMARQGKIKNMTGLDAPFEEPTSSELIIDTDRQTIDKSVHEIVGMLRRCRLINSPCDTSPIHHSQKP